MSDGQDGNGTVSISVATSRAPTRYGSVAILLHWATAAAFALQIGLGWQMGGPGGPQRFAAYQLHKSIGIAILLLTVIRIGWRLAHPAPPLATTLHPIERGLARLIHGGFYALLLLMPLSGWLIVSTSPTAIPTYLFGTIPWPHLPVPAAWRGGVNGAAGSTHLVLAWIALAMIALHIAGALKHQLFDHDDELGRMAPVPRAMLSWLAILLPVTVPGLMAIGWTVRLAPARAPSAAIEPGRAQPVVGGTAREVTAPVPLPTPSATPAPAPAPAPTTTTNVEPSVWTVRPAGRRIGFRTTWSQGTVDGRFDKWSAAIKFDPAALDLSSVTVTIDLASVATAASDQQAALPGDDWFATALHPQAVFSASRFRHLGGDRFRADGTLTLRGVARPQRVDFTLGIAGDVATVSGHAQVDRTAFGVGQGEWSSTDDLPARVQISIALTADRKR